MYFRLLLKVSAKWINVNVYYSHKLSQIISLTLGWFTIRSDIIKAPFILWTVDVKFRQSFYVFL